MIKTFKNNSKLKMSNLEIKHFLRKKEKFKILFVGEVNPSLGSDRIYLENFMFFLGNTKFIEPKISGTIPKNSDSDIIIFKKGSYKNKDLIPLKKKSLIGIIHPSKKNNLKVFDFAIVGSIEEKAYYSKYFKCFVFPQIEIVDSKLIRNYDERPSNVICYHGNKVHLDLIHTNLEKALIRLKSEGFIFKAIYNHKILGKCKKKFITDHVQWDPDTWLKEIAYSSVGICPASHYSGILREKLARFALDFGKVHNQITSNDLLLKHKNTLNAGRSFVYHQLKVPVVAEIASSHHHIMGDESTGLLCYSENSWYE